MKYDIVLATDVVCLPCAYIHLSEECPLSFLKTMYLEWPKRSKKRKLKRSAKTFIVSESDDNDGDKKKGDKG